MNEREQEVAGIRVMCQSKPHPPANSKINHWDFREPIVRFNEILLLNPLITTPNVFIMLFALLVN